MNNNPLPLPDFFDPERVSDVWRVIYQARATDGRNWAQQHHIDPALEDEKKVGLLLVDVQNTFCIPDFELFVGGESGKGAVDDNKRLCEFIYRNLHHITQICPTMDTHQAAQVFHCMFLVDDDGRHPKPHTMISLEDIKKGFWHVNPHLYDCRGMDAVEGKAYLNHYAKSLAASGKYELTIWPYHAMLGGIGHALVSAVEEAVFFHTIARQSQPDIQIKGGNPLTENYSALKPEVTSDQNGENIDEKNRPFIQKLLGFDALIVAGQAKSHCVAWTVQDLLNEIVAVDPQKACAVYLMEDCTSPVVIPGVTSYAAQADDAFRRFADAGMHIVRSTDAMDAWPDFQ